MLGKKSLAYQSDPDDPNVIAVGDAERVKQILVNLLANAVKFTQRGGQITTRCEAVGDQVHISVIDNGIGIAPAKLAAIFEPFVQVDPEHPIDSGVGLGLAISRDLARTMHGDLTVESEVGVGSCFVLTLPRAIRISTKQVADRNSRALRTSVFSQRAQRNGTLRNSPAPIQTYRAMIVSFSC